MCRDVEAGLVSGSCVFLARLLFRSELFGRRFLGGLMFRLVSGFLARRFATAAFLPLVILPRPFFTWMFRTPFTFTLRLVTRCLDAAQGAPEILDFPLVAHFLFFRQFNQFQNVLHLLERFLERFDDPAHLIHGGGERRRGMLLPLSLRVLFMPRPFGGRRSINRFGFRLSPFRRRGLHGRLFARMFFWRRRRRLTSFGHRSGTRRRDGMSRTHAASTPATATPAATG